MDVKNVGKTTKQEPQFPLVFIQCLKLLALCVNHNIIQQDPNNRNNVLVYREAGEVSPEGWYTENIHAAAQELMADEEGQRFLVSELTERGASLDEIVNAEENLKAIGEVLAQF